MRNPIRIAVRPARFRARLASRSRCARKALWRRRCPQSVGALERGYRTGYSDGYQAGYRDNAANARRAITGTRTSTRRADRAYASSYGTLEDYRDGYQQGFEVGYDAGYDRRGFNSTIPANISRRGVVDPQATTATTDVDDDQTLSDFAAARQ